MSKKTIIFLISLILLMAVGVGNAERISTTVFVPDSPLYFLKEWTRSSESFLAFDAEKRIQLKLGFCFEKLNELRNVSAKSTETALANYLSETEELKQASESLRGMNNDALSNKLVADAFYQRKVLAGILKVEESDKNNYALATSFGNLISGASSIGSQKSILGAINSHLTTLQNEKMKVEELEYVLDYTSDASLKESILELQLEIIQNRIAEGFDDDSLSNYFESKLSGIQVTEFYRKRLLAIEKVKQQKLTELLVKGNWIDGVIAEVPGEEVEILQRFKTRLSNMSIEKIDQKIDELQVYDDTKTLLKEAKNEIVASIYGEPGDTQILGVMEENEKPLKETEKNKNPEKISPASAYCVRLGYDIVQIIKDGTDSIVCTNGKQECEELSFYKGECKFDESNESE